MSYPTPRDRYLAFHVAKFLSTLTMTGFHNDLEALLSKKAAQDRRPIRTPLYTPRSKKVNQDIYINHHPNESASEKIQLEAR